MTYLIKTERPPRTGDYVILHHVNGRSEMQEVGYVIEEVVAGERFDVATFDGTVLNVATSDMYHWAVAKVGGPLWRVDFFSNNDATRRQTVVVADAETAVQAIRKAREQYDANEKRDRLVWPGEVRRLRRRRWVSE